METAAKQMAESNRVAETIWLGAGAFIKKPLTIKSIDQAIRTELNKKGQEQNI